jgi:hypothetical protein
MMALATTQKGNMSISEYIAKIKPFVDEMAPAGKGLEDEELVSYILAGLDFDYNPIVSAIVAHVEPISVGELYSRLLNFEARWEPGKEDNNHLQMQHDEVVVNQAQVVMVD